jgi:glucose-1-phosphate thymidylyltransferase
VRIFDRGFAWLDTGTPQSLQQASQYVQTIQERQGTPIACLEEIAYAQGFIGRDVIQERIAFLGDNDYSAYLSRLLEREALLL